MPSKIDYSAQDQSFPFLSFISFPKSNLLIKWSASAAGLQPMLVPQTLDGRILSYLREPLESKLQVPVLNESSLFLQLFFHCNE